MGRLLRVGLIGAGRWGQVYLRTIPALRSRCRLTHLCTSQPQHAKLVPHPVQIVRRWQELRPGDCDVVIIATPPSTHAEILEAFLDAGTSCVVEKPLCLDVKTAERLNERVQTTGVPVLVDHTHLFHPAYERLKACLARDGHAIRVVLSEGMALGPFRCETPVLWDWCAHDVSLCLDLFGRLPQGVDVLEGPRSPRRSAELVSLRLDFSGGACAWVQAGCLSTQKRRRLSVFTDRRLYVLDELASPVLSVSPLAFDGRYDRAPEIGAATALPVEDARRPMERMLTYVFDGVEGGDRRLFGTELALAVVRVLSAVEGAAKSRVGRSQGLGARTRTPRGSRVKAR